jgi:hypothetical protein
MCTLSVQYCSAWLQPSTPPTLQGCKVLSVDVFLVEHFFLVEHLFQRIFVDNDHNVDHDHHVNLVNPIHLVHYVHIVHLVLHDHAGTNILCVGGLAKHDALTD